jgi:hypothetical protein
LEECRRTGLDDNNSPTKTRITLRQSESETQPSQPCGQKEGHNQDEQKEWDHRTIPRIELPLTAAVYFPDATFTAKPDGGQPDSDRLALEL